MTETALHRITSIPVLDNGFVRVVDRMGDDAAIVQAARVSYGPGTKTVSDDRALIRYLVRHRHTSPLEMCEIKLHIKLPIFVARQFIRHRTANVNEVSARYSEVPDEFYIPAEPDICRQATDSKQGRGKPVDDPEADRYEFEAISGIAHSAYCKLLDESEVARELARIVLPLNSYTEWYWKCDLHNLLHFLKLRSDPHAQLEIRRYAEAIEKIVTEWVPLAYEAWVDYVRDAVVLSKMEATLMASALANFEVAHLVDLVRNDDRMSAREKREFLARWT